ncbi:Ureidoglycolate lyase [Pseudogymnoascus destructans]|uniref:Ureidoglycolate lyase n=1 Tax=Pseudogymnoascus destructans TaxID=655981 RepID=A0A177A737_9PEZI|nr:Ureidoglycolate lyase [Pseudogymnoascus destructans]OAF57968.1 Ureidoglycolate lyase [Pseudogymnoascus destructans]
MFVCAPRALAAPTSASGGLPTFPVEILERHPFTTQTFVPLGLSASSADVRYLVIVAPSLPPSSGGLLAADPAARLPGKNLPDLSKMEAFSARGDQGVTYAPGTWHAPMVVLGEMVGFVVAQFVNAVGEEDCQEVVWNGEGGEGAVIGVAVPGVGGSRL